MLSHLWRLLVKALKFVRNFIAFMSIILFCLLISFQFEKSQRFYLDLVNDALKDSAIEIKTGQITGFFPFFWELDTLQLADQQGDWLQLENLQLNWTLLSLFSSNFELQKLSAQSLTIFRLPLLTSATAIDETKTDIEVQNIDALNESKPSLIVNSLIINELAIGSIYIAKQLLLESSEIDSSQSLSLAQLNELKNQPFLKFNLAAQSVISLSHLSTLKLKLSNIDYSSLDAKPPQVVSQGVKNVDGKGDSKADSKIKEQLLDNNNLSLNLAYYFQTNQLSLQTDIKLSELLIDKLNGDLIELPEQIELGDIVLQLNGHAPVDNWHGEMQLFAAKIGTLKSSIQLNHYLASSLSANSTSLTNRAEFIIDAQGQFKHSQQIINWKTKTSLYNNNQLQIDSLNLNSQGLTLDVKGQLDIDKLAGSFILDSQINDLTELSKQPDIALILHSLSPDLVLSGSNTLHADIVMDENANNIQIDTASHIDNLKGFPAQVMDVLGTSPKWQSKLTILHKEQIKVKILSLNTRAIDLNIRGEVNLSNKLIDANINTKIADLSLFSEALKQPIAGHLEQSIKLSGTLEKPTLKLILKAQQLVLNHYPLGNLEIKSELKDFLDKPQGHIQIDMAYKKQMLNLVTNFQLNDKNFTLSEFNFVAPESNIKGQMQLNFDTNLAKGRFDGKLNQLSKLVFLHQQEDLAGDIKFHLNLDAKTNSLGNLDQFVEYEVNSKQLDYSQLSMQKLNLSGEISGLQQAMTIDSILDIKKIKFIDQANNPQQVFVVLTAKGNPEKIKFDLKTATENKQLWLNLSGFIEQQLEQKIEQPFEQQSKQKTAQNIAQKQQPRSLNIELQNLQGQFLNRSLKLTKATSIKFLSSSAEEKIEINPVQLSYGKALLDLEAKLEQQKDKITANLKIKDLPLQLLSELDPQQAALSQIEGKAMLDLSINGSLKKPQIKLNAKIKQLALDKSSHKKLPLVDVSLVSSLGRIKDYSKYPQQAELKSAQTQNSFQKLTNQLEISGLTKKPVSISLQLPIELSLLPFKLNWENQTKTNQYNTLQGQLNADVDLKNLQNWLELEQQLVSGQLIADIQLSGNSYNPSIKGDISIKQGRYENAQTGTILKDIVADIKVSEKLIQLLKLSANDAQQGQITATGQVLLDASQEIDFIKQYQFKMNLIKSQLLNQDDMSLQVSGDLNLTGNSQQGKLQSLITIDRGEFFLPESTGADLPELKVVEVNKPGEIDHKEKQQAAKDSYLLALDASIKIPSKMYVRGRGLESEWSGEVAISGKAADPLLEGHLQITRGYLNFISHRFNFRKGTINFVGSVPPQPQLDFELLAKGKEVTAILKITGDAQKPDIKLESEPMMPNDEILSQLLFNKEISKISGLEALQLASAVRTLTTGGSGFMDKTRDSLGIDTLDVNGDKETGSSVKMGKHISDNVYVEVETGLTSADSQVKVEMDITDSISVESRVDQESNTGVGVNWKFSY